MIPTVALVVGAVVAGVFLVAGGLAVRTRDHPGALPFAVLTGLLAATALVSAVGLGVRPGLTRDAVYSVFVFVSLAWGVLAVEYTGRGPAVTRSLLAAVAAVGLFAALSTTLGEGIGPPFRAAVLTANFVVQAVTASVVAYGLLVVGRSAIRYDELPSGGGLLLGTLGAGIVVQSFAHTAASVVGARTVLAAILVTSALMAPPLVLAQVRDRAFGRRPSAGHLARETVLEAMGDPVVVADRRGRVLDCNGAAERTFGVDRAAALGRPATAVLGREVAPDDPGPVELDTTDGRRQFDASVTELAADDAGIGRAYRLRDVTDRRTHEQRLDVLTRVLRHNLRNDLDAVRGFAETVGIDGADGPTDPAALCARIESTARDLASLGETVARTERLLARPRTAESVDVAALAREVAADVGSSFEGTVEVVAEGSDLAVRTDRRLLAAVLTELVENALEHADRDAPTATVTVGRAGDELVIEVADEGPGIPERERAVLLDGAETPLRHGTGLGLWLAHWATVRLGGRLAFGEADPRGSVVTVRVPARTDGRAR